MKNTLLYGTLIAGIALAGCNKSTRTSTADTTVPPTDTTAAARPATTPTDTVGGQVRRGGDRGAGAPRDAAASMGQAGRGLSTRMTELGVAKSDIEADVMADCEIIPTRSGVTPPLVSADA